MENNVDRPGMDYRNFDLSSPDPQLCEQECANDPKCKAFTYVKPGYQGPNARCWLKTGVPDPIPAACCISGVK
ncbi:MAG: PAN domain-containing protein [Euryarchaeota archaeon]|nr:PAN domain-containing protein [Euryarchaeota archaeon]